MWASQWPCCAASAVSPLTARRTWVARRLRWGTSRTSRKAPPLKRTAGASSLYSNPSLLFHLGRGRAMPRQAMLGAATPRRTAGAVCARQMLAATGTLGTAARGACLQSKRKPLYRTCGQHPAHPPRAEVTGCEQRCSGGSRNVVVMASEACSQHRVMNCLS